MFRWIQTLLRGAFGGRPASVDREELEGLKAMAEDACDVLVHHHKGIVNRAILALDVDPELGRELAHLGGEIMAAVHALGRVSESITMLGLMEPRGVGRAERES